ncbi:MAG TPA: hypothetical protein VHE60_19510 [Pyrinomonadaceae bacterium]|nr:hypothetical protein [Pyrinomonadaceae bacterium]
MASLVNVIVHLYEGTIVDVEVIGSEEKAAERIIDLLRDTYRTVSKLRDRLKYAKKLYDAQDAELQVRDLSEEIRWLATEFAQ